MWKLTPVLAGDNEGQAQCGSHKGQRLGSPVQLHFRFVGAGAEEEALWREDQDGFRQA